MSKNDFTVGLDIGARAIKAVLLNSTKTGFVVEKFHTIDFETDVTDDGSIVDYGELVHRLGEVVDASFPTRNVGIALKGPSVIIRKVNVNNDSLGDLGEFRWIAEQYAAVEPEEMCLDFETLPSHDLYNHTGIVMTAAQKDVVTDFVSIVESARLVPVVIEAEAMSLVRLFRSVVKDYEETQMILHVGYVGSFVIILKNGLFDYSREISKGGKFFTDILVSDVGVTKEQAEIYKFSPEESDQADQIVTTLDRVLSIDYAKQVEDVIILYKLRHGDDPKNIYLSGGSCLVNGLAKALQDKFNIPVEYLDPWKVIHLPNNVYEIKDEERYSYSTVLGLALHGKVY